jgi:hypothetical protein
MADQKKTDTVESRMSKQIRKGLERAARQARRVGGRVSQAMADTPEFISLQRNDRALQHEMNEVYEKIGKRVVVLHKRSKGESPFSRYTAILGEIERLETLEREYRVNKAQLAEVRRLIKKGR